MVSGIESDFYDLKLVATLLTPLTISDSFLCSCAKSAFVFSAAALYGVLFKDSSKAAYSNYQMWRALGKLIAFAYQSHLPFKIKAYILLASLILGMIGYGTVELIEYKKKKRQISVQ